MKNRKIPMRQCVGCRENKEKKELIRIVKTTSEDEGTERICVDLTGKAKGRGAYLCRNPQCLKLARKNNGLNRAFKMNVTDETYQELERQLSE